MRKLKLCLALYLLYGAAQVHGQEEEVINLGTTVTGNQEQPKVLYIVPWKQAEDDSLLYQALNPSAVDRIFSHVERSEHRRQIEFIESLEK